MDLFGMYGSRSDDEPANTPEPSPGEPVAEPPPVEPEEDTAPVERIPSARDDAVRHFIDSMEGVEFDGQIVRPYARTGGRTRSVAGLELETLLSLTVADVPGNLPPDHYAVAELCRRPVSVAEVAGYRSLPIGAARVIISDLIETGFLATSGPETAGAPTVDLMRRVLEGLHRL
ncbi:DUF742 domain-containing protein [Actinophytocola algeriensis]|uniref:DUF742 domain-containing protein n=1 Tax=Actinophytocola algeriensis TaxID=1768010 RepID=A0A7W7VCJ1_9PSEU|nr:DUF742 domain-containing protein [Actinophytocola algeriensis]MBB4905161.1 hypothetical protein [Actinophytocola algeriensis]MBE1473154.1 hypothetical protein [Actinophytocola algeriensis]